MKKIVVTGTRGIPGVMGGVETHCEELFPRLAERGWDVTVVRRSNYVEDGLKEWKGVRLVTLPSPKKKSFEAIIHTFRAINEARRVGADILHIHAIGPALLVPYAKMLGMYAAGAFRIAYGSSSEQRHAGYARQSGTEYQYQ